MGGVNLESGAEIDAAQNRPEGGGCPLEDTSRGGCPLRILLAPLHIQEVKLEFRVR
jgi:hypothetical protein